MSQFDIGNIVLLHFIAYHRLIVTKYLLNIYTMPPVVILKHQTFTEEIIISIEIFKVKNFCKTFEIKQ